jgi:uncharacterized Zn finger protein
MRYAEKDILLRVGPARWRPDARINVSGAFQKFDQMGRTIAAKVQGNERRPYVQDVTFRRSADGRMSFSSTWICPVGQSCKHVPAAPLGGLASAQIEEVMCKNTSATPAPKCPRRYQRKRD